MKIEAKKWNRRDFLKTSGGAVTGMVLFSTLPTGLAKAESPDLASLSTMIFEMFPHYQVPLKYYHQTAQAFIQKAHENSEMRKSLSQTLATADAFYGKPFYTLTRSKRSLVMDRIRPTSFYSSLRGHTIVALYNNPDVWPYFGFPGSSFEVGGYIGDPDFGKIFWLN